MNAAPHLPGFLNTIAPLLEHYGYFAVAGLLFIEDFGVPAPGETILIAASIYAGAGRLNVWVVVLLGFLAAMLGDNVGFAIGYYGGEPLVRRLGRYVFLTPERLDKAEIWFQRHGGKIIVIARFVEGLRQANGIIAGISHMRWVRFLAFNAVGAALWVGCWVSVGYLAGNHIVTIYDTLQRYEIYVLIAVAVLIVAVIVRYPLKRRRSRGIPEAAGETHAAAGRSSETTGETSEAAGGATGRPSERPGQTRKAGETHAAAGPALEEADRTGETPNGAGRTGEEHGRAPEGPGRAGGEPRRVCDEPEK